VTLKTFKVARAENAISKKYNEIEDFLSYSLILFFTLILLEVSSFFLFQSLTEKEFTYATIQNERFTRIVAIQKQLQHTQSQALYNFHPSDKEKKMAIDPKLSWGIAAREGYTYLI
jgi:hypothetical protein